MEWEPLADEPTQEEQEWYDANLAPLGEQQVLDLLARELGAEVISL